MAQLASFAALEASHVVLPPEQGVHPDLWWRLWGATFRLLQPVTVHLLAMPPSAAGGKRMFKALKSVLTTRRNRLANCRVDSQTRVVFNSAQLRRGDVMGAYRRPIAEHELVAMLAGETGTGAPQQAPPPVADDGGDHEETSGGSGGSDSDAESTDDVDGVDDDIAVGRTFDSDGVDVDISGEAPHRRRCDSLSVCITRHVLICTKLLRHNERTHTPGSTGPFSHP